MGLEISVFCSAADELESDASCGFGASAFDELETGASVGFEVSGCSAVDGVGDSLKSKTSGSLTVAGGGDGMGESGSRSIHSGSAWPGDLFSSLILGLPEVGSQLLFQSFLTAKVLILLFFTHRITKSFFESSSVVFGVVG